MILMKVVIMIMTMTKATMMTIINVHDKWKDNCNYNDGNYVVMVIMMILKKIMVIMTMTILMMIAMMRILVSDIGTRPAILSTGTPK